MGDALFELEQVLRSKQNPRLTSQEANVLMQCKAKAIKDFTVGNCVGGGIAWLVTRRFNNLLRINVTVGTALCSGMWRLTESLESCNQYILGLEGTRIQRELATIMLTKHRDDPMTTRLVSKHFYSEKVFDESSSDQATVRWRHRNNSGDNIVHSARTQNTHSYGYETAASSENNNFVPKQLPVKSGGADASSNPFDCVFGPSEIQIGEIEQPDSSSTPPKRHSRSHKRSRRRHRVNNHEDSSNNQHT